MINISKDELYPFFNIDEDYGGGLELTEEEAVFVKNSLENFWKVQELLEEKYDEENKKRGHKCY